jgi:hypothetical protein
MAGLECSTRWGIYSALNPRGRSLSRCTSFILDRNIQSIFEIPVALGSRGFNAPASRYLTRKLLGDELFVDLSFSGIAGTMLEVGVW